MKNRHSSRSSTNVLVACLGCLLTSAGLSFSKDAPAADLLRALNGDSLHGEFLGLKGQGLEFKASHALRANTLDITKIRRIALNGGRASKSLQSPSFVLLQGGDRIPGTILSLDDSELALETDFAGVLKIPREFVTQLSPNPHGGSIHYVGPYADEWTVIRPKEVKEEENEEAKEAEGAQEAAPDANEDEQGENAVEEPEEEGPWVFSGGAYYSNGQLPIAIDTKAGDATRFRFTLAWRNRLNTAIAFHATLKPPEQQEPEEGAEKKPAAGGRGNAVQALAFQTGGSSNFAKIYGASYVLTIYSNYAQLYRCSFNKEGEPQIDRLSTSSSNLRLDESGAAEFELRCDRKNGSITFYADGKYVSQWSDRRGFAGTGSHLAFSCQSRTSRLRVSDVVVTAWNGMIDSAQSMESKDRDIVLLTNGTDRFSGQLQGLQDGKLQLKGSYAEMQIPVGEVQEIRFASGNLSEEDAEEHSRQNLRVLMQPFGRITLHALSSSEAELKATHSACGPLTLKLDYAGLLEFAFGDSVLDSWDDDF